MRYYFPWGKKLTWIISDCLYIQINQYRIDSGLNLNQNASVWIENESNLSQYPALNTVASHQFRCHTWTQDLKCSILSVICFFFQFTRYTLHVLRGTLAPSPHLHARQLERLPPSYREQRIRECRGLRDTCISPSVRSREHGCPSAWSTHTHTQHSPARRASSCTETPMQCTKAWIFCTHGRRFMQDSCTGDDLGRPGNNLKAMCFNSALNWLPRFPAAWTQVYSPRSINTCV